MAEKPRHLSAEYFREYRQKTGRTHQDRVGRPSVLSEEHLRTLCAIVSLRLDQGLPVRPQELSLLIERLTGRPGTKHQCGVAKAYFKKHGVVARKGESAKKAKSVGDPTRVGESFTAYEFAVNEATKKSTAFGPHLILVADETSLAMETANAGGGAPVVYVPRSVNGRIVVPGMEKGALPSCTFINVVSLTGVTVCYGFVFQRRQWSQGDFARKHRFNTGRHSVISLKDEHIIMIGNETGKFTQNDYHIFVEFALDAARKTLAATTADEMIYVHDSAPAHGDTRELLAAAATHRTSLVMLAGGVTPLVQLHDIGLFGPFKVAMKRAMLAVHNVLSSFEYALDEEYVLTLVDPERRTRQDAWLTDVEKNMAHLVNDCYERLGHTDGSMTPREVVNMAVRVWKRVLEKEKVNRVVDVAALAGYWPVNRLKWLQRIFDWKKPMHSLIAEMKKRNAEAERARRTEVEAMATPPPAVTPSFTRPLRTYQITIRGVSNVTDASPHEGDKLRLLAHYILEEFEAGDDLNLPQTLARVSELLRDGVADGSVKTSFQKADLTPRRRTPGVRSRHRSQVQEEVLKGGGRERGKTHESRVITVAEAAAQYPTVSTKYPL